MTTTRLKRNTLIIATPNGIQRITSAWCPTCQIDRPTYHDQTGAAYFARHQQSGRSTWCKMSGKSVKA